MNDSITTALTSIRLAQRDYVRDCAKRGHDSIMLGFVLQAQTRARKAGATEDQIATAMRRGGGAA